MASEYGLTVSKDTIGRRLDAAGLCARVPVKKPLIRAKNRKIRLTFAKEHESWTTKDWKKVLWSDESKFNLFGSDGRRYIRRPKGTRMDPRYQRPTVKHGGGSVMVWGAFHHGGVGPLVHIDGIMDQNVYKNILEDHMLPYARKKVSRSVRGWMFQQDNDPKHTYKMVKNWFTAKKIKILDWPSQSADLNPIEHLWEHLGRKVGTRKHSSKTELLQDLQSEWAKIPS
ncbi:paired box protein and transposase domain containing protein, partial [Lasius niger]